MKCSSLQFFVLSLAGMVVAWTVARGQEPRRDADPPPVREGAPRVEGPRDRAAGQPRPMDPRRSGDPAGRRPPLDAKGPPAQFDPLSGPPGFGVGPGPRGGRPGFRGPPDGLGFPGNPALADPEMAELLKMDADLEDQTRLLVQRILQSARLTAKQEEVDRTKAQLKEAVAKHFEVRQKRRELQIKRMEEELKRLQDAVAKRNESRDEIIQKRIAELLGPPEDLGF